MLNKFFKKSISSKLFFMNLLILVCIVVLQLLFQAIYFEKYYLNQKKEFLEKKIERFKELLNEEYDPQNIMNFIQEIKKNDNVSIAFRNENLSGGIGMEPYMGERYIVLEDNITNKTYKVIIGSQFENIKFKKGDYIQCLGGKDDYGYVFVNRIFINNVEAKGLYEIVPSDNSASSIIPAIVTTTMEEQYYIEGYVKDVVKKNDKYIAFSNIDLYLDNEVKSEIMKNNKYNTKVQNINSIDELLVSSEKVNGGYIITYVPLVEVNDVIGTMNNYYFIVFFVALILVIIISLVYSKVMTKPLVAMSKIAKKISECDFKYRYNVNTEDEIGVLGNSLNLISENLERSLRELKEANLKLKDDMDIQRVQEEKRKELIANISHELKTPITIIQGSIYGIKNGMYTPEMYEDILEETNKMNSLVKEMLEVSKLESPNFELSKCPFDLCSVVLKEYDKLKSIILEKKLNIVLEMEDEAVAFADEKRINQVVTNLFTNAIKYTPNGETIKIIIKPLDDENKYIFSIENFGVALDEGEIKKVWDSFYRKEKSRNKKFGGTGLGLAIVKRILELHNYEYGVISEKSSVRFYFIISKCENY